MLTPSPYENIKKSTIVIGYDILMKLNKRAYNLEELYSEIKKKKNVGINQFFNSLTYLWLLDLVSYKDHLVEKSTNK